mgnify:CR=1 FL=1
MTYSPLPPLTDSPEWEALREQAESLRPRHMRELFSADVPLGLNRSRT